jgi:hypothetical protein
VTTGTTGSTGTAGGTASTTTATTPAPTPAPTNTVQLLAQLPPAQATVFTEVATQGVNMVSTFVTLVAKAETQQQQQSDSDKPANKKAAILVAGEDAVCK